eukprot:TRINITY_DN30441_c0_g1_i1.p1 TRINITY_DN30441_c0_g1~~TRINITY_DN30441_c0_g1_i1.p1  ORF type:complete len:577 (+),score=74.77 TRINITY_DN30441_c0_g1_i1:52-1731(+)
MSACLLSRCLLALSFSNSLWLLAGIAHLVLTEGSVSTVFELGEVTQTNETPREVDTLSEYTPSAYLPVSYSWAMQPLVEISLGGQQLNLVFDASSANTIAFVKEYGACTPTSLKPCYSYKAAEAHGGLHVCEENNELGVLCEVSPDRRYTCTKFLESLVNATSHKDELIIDGLEYIQDCVEAVDTASVKFRGKNEHSVGWVGTPVRLLTKAMEVRGHHGAGVSLRLFEGADGILGASGPTLSCRNTTLWESLLKSEEVKRFALDLRPPPNATIKEKGSSRIVLNELNPAYEKALVWSQPKQTGDMHNDGMHEFLIYRPKVCGVDLLYNTSSNWLAIIDTSGPCLAMIPFLFDRIMKHIPVDCPFEWGTKSYGQLCSPRRTQGALLPTLSFQLQDSQEPEPPQINLPLERLVFKNGTGHELLCLARQDADTESIPPDMMYSHIAVGSMAVAALYTVIDLETHRVGLASRGDPATESSNAGCAQAATCVAMQKYFPPLNLCENPQCGQYIFMALDEETKMCVWKPSVPVVFVFVLVSLVVLDLLSHRLYKQAIRRASEFQQ